MAGNFYSPTEILAIRVVATDGAGGGNVNFDYTMTRGLRFHDAVVIKTGGAGAAAHTLTVQQSGNAISDAMSLNVADETVVRPAVLTDAQHNILTGGTLRLALVDGGAGNTAFEAYVLGSATWLV